MSLRSTMAMARCRRLRPQLLAVGLLGLVAVTSTACARTPFPLGGDGEPTLAPILKRAAPAVVNIANLGVIRAQNNPLLSDPGTRQLFEGLGALKDLAVQSVGSGVIIDAQRGYVLTNHHVIASADRVVVIMGDGERLKAQLLGSDDGTDLALLQVPAAGLTALPLGNSDQLQVGDFVIAIGNPFGLGQTVTSGVVSALRRSGLGIEGLEDFIQTDASINPGNSGGALVNLKGQLVGINTAILAPSGGNIGIGFAIPINMAHKIADQIAKFGEVKRGQLGVQVQGLSADLARAFRATDRRGVVITLVEPDSPADRASLREGDIITAIDGEPVTRPADLENKVGLLRIGERVPVDILRDGKHLQAVAVIAEPRLSRFDIGDAVPQLAGVVFAAADRRPSQKQEPGVLVLSADAESPAWEAGLRLGDVVVAVNRSPIANDQDMIRAVQRDAPLLLSIRRDDTAMFIVIR